MGWDGEAAKKKEKDKKRKKKKKKHDLEKKERCFMYVLCMYYVWTRTLVE